MHRCLGTLLAAAGLLIAPAIAPAANVPADTPPFNAELIPAHGAASTSLATSWTQAFATGNGRMGALELGDDDSANSPRPQDDILFVSHNGLFLPIGSREIVPNLAADLPSFRQTIRTRGYGPALMSAAAAARKQNYPGLLYPDPFIPAFELHISIPAAGTARNYLRTENFQTGEVTSSYSDDSGTFTRKIFISRADNLGVLQITLAPAAAANSLSCDISIPPIPNVPVRTFLQNNPDAAPADAAADALIHSARDSSPASITLHNTFREAPGTGYDAALRIIPENGPATVADNKISIKSAHSLLILFRVELFSHESPHSAQKLLDSLASYPADYATLLAPHRKIHQQLFDRVALDLHAGPDRLLTTDQLLARARRENVLCPALLERLYDASRYAAICSSGNGGVGAEPGGGGGAPNLQGIWAGTFAPSPTLAGDYSFDTAFPLSIASDLSCNTPELLSGAFRLADESLSDWQLNAKNLFGLPGILVPPHQSSNGKDLQWSDRSASGLCWISGAGALAHFYFEKYLYTGDKNFLANSAVPFMKQAALFYEGYLTKEPSPGGGPEKYRFSPSYSPDDAPGDNSAQEIMVCRELFTNLTTAARILHADQQNIPRWQAILDGLPPYLIAPDGQLQEWALPDVMNKSGHRHIPHLYAVYQSHEFDPEKTPDLWKASHAAYLARLNQWFRIPHQEMNPQPLQDRLLMGLCAARFGEGDTVYEILSRLAARNTYPSLLEQKYEDGKTFAASSGSAIAEILNSALLDSRPGRLDLLPALPTALPSGEIRGLAARAGENGPLTLTRLAWSPHVIDLELFSPHAQTLEIRALHMKPQTLTLPANQKTSLHIILP